MKKDASESRDRGLMELLAAHAAQSVATTVEAERVFAVPLIAVVARWVDSPEANGASRRGVAVLVGGTWQERWHSDRDSSRRFGSAEQKCMLGSRSPAGTRWVETATWASLVSANLGKTLEGEEAGGRVTSPIEERWRKQSWCPK